jgi:hypothetical protein
VRESKCARILFPLLSSFNLLTSFIYFTSFLLLISFISNADPAGIREVVTVLSSLIIFFIHTREGSKVGAYCFLYGDVKERKQMLKTMKEHVEAIAFSRFAYLVVLVALATVDDTSLASKSLLIPLLPSLFQAATHPFTSRILLSILTAPSQRYNDKLELDYIEKSVMVPSKDKVGYVFLKLFT